MTLPPQKPPLVKPGNAATTLIGLARLARFNRAGFAAFGETREHFLTSLAPLVAFPVVGGLLMALRGDLITAATELSATLCALLAPAVVSERLARWWKRDGEWLRYATAFNWCQWAIPVAAMLLLIVLGILLKLGLPDRTASVLAVAGVVGYGVSLHWFLARHGLRLSRGRAVGMVVAINLGTTLLVMLPQLLARALGEA